MHINGGRARHAEGRSSRYALSTRCPPTRCRSCSRRPGRWCASAHPSFITCSDYAPSFFTTPRLHVHLVRHPTPRRRLRPGAPPLPCRASWSARSFHLLFECPRTCAVQTRPLRCACTSRQTRFALRTNALCALARVAPEATPAAYSESYRRSTGQLDCCARMYSRARTIAVSSPVLLVAASAPM